MDQPTDFTPIQTKHPRGIVPTGHAQHCAARRKLYTWGKSVEFEPHFLLAAFYIQNIDSIVVATHSDAPAVWAKRNAVLI
jgi:hypothetical protein